MDNMTSCFTELHIFWADIDNTDIRDTRNGDREDVILEARGENRMPDLSSFHFFHNQETPPR